MNESIVDRPTVPVPGAVAIRSDADRGQKMRAGGDSSSMAARIPFPGHGTRRADGPGMRLLICSAAALLVMASVACGSKGGDEATAADEVTSIPRTDPAPVAQGPDAAPGAPLTPPPTEIVDGGAGEGGGDGGGGGAGTGGGGGGGANPLCAAASVHETEANDSEGTANALPNATSSFCGTLGSGADVDFVSFVLPADAKSIGFGAEYSLQGLAIDGTAGGQAFNVGGAAAFKPGQKYVFKIHTTGAAAVNYRFDVTIGK